MECIEKTLLRLWLGIGLCALSGLSAALAASSAQQPRRPNMVVVLTDDQRWDAMGRAGRFPFLSTPNMDRLASEGVYFSNSFVTTSLCSPNRASLLTGTYAHRHGVRLNAVNDPDPSVPAFPQLLQTAGYDTAFVGKWHMAPTSDPRPGYDYWLSFEGQGVYLDPTLNENGHTFTKPGYITDLLTDYATQWLRRGRDRPFLLILSHKASHAPFTPAPRHREAFADAELPRPASHDDDLEGKPRWLRQYVRYGIRRYSRGKSVPDALPPKAWDPHKKQYLDYLRTLLAVDESLGEILSTLESLDKLDNTLIVYTSDNGYLLGEHQNTNKQLMYEESIRVPLILRFPSSVHAGAVRPEMVASIDIAPTLLEIAGVEIPDTVQGRSLLGLAEHQDRDWRSTLFYEYFEDRMWPGIPTILGVRTARWKYIQTPELAEDIDELYDLKSDPAERHNLAADPRYVEVLDRLRSELAGQIQVTDYSPPETPSPMENLVWKAKYLARDAEYEIKKLPHRIKALLK